MTKLFFFVCVFSKAHLNLSAGVPMGRPFFNQARLGGGIPVASQAKVTGLLMVSTTLSSAGPSILGGTEERYTLSVLSIVNTIYVLWS